MLVTERPGRLRIVRRGVLDPQAISGVPQVRTDGNGGLMDVALHPRFADNRFVYLTYTKLVGNGMGAPVIARGRLELARSPTSETFSSPTRSRQLGSQRRVVFGGDGKVYMSTGGNVGNVSQDPTNLRGKILRLNDDGSVPSDNPFVGHVGHRPENLYLGEHRNTLGFIVPPRDRGALEPRKCPNGGDEINIILRGRNYGWPVVSFGRNYPGARIAEHPTREGMESAARGVAARHRGRRPGRLHRRPISCVERKRVRRIPARGRNSGHGPPAAHRVQRQDRGVAPRVDVDGAQATHPGSARRARRVPLLANGRRTTVRSCVSSQPREPLRDAPDSRLSCAPPIRHRRS